MHEGSCLCGCGQETERWEVAVDGRTIGTYRLYVRGHENHPGDPDLKKQEDRLEKRDPLCLRMGDEQGNDLIDRVIAHYGTAIVIEDLMGMSHGALNRYRNERYIHFDLVDRLLLMIGEPYELANYEFRRRSEWQKSHPPEIRESRVQCKLEDCNSPMHAKGMCGRHYRQYRRQSVSSPSLG